MQVGWKSGSVTSSLISQPFLFVPGYYQIKYNYISQVLFAALGGTTYCGSTPSAASIASLSSASSKGTDRVRSTDYGTLPQDSNVVGVFMSHAQLASTPNSGNAVGSATSFKKSPPAPSIM